MKTKRRAITLDIRRMIMSQRKEIDQRDKNKKHVREKIRQEEILKQKEEVLKQKEEVLRKQKEEILKKQKEEKKKQKDEVLKKQKEEVLKKQKREILRNQQEILKKQKEEIVRKQNEILRKQNEILIKQKEEKQKKEILKKQKEEMKKQKKEEMKKQKEEMKKQKEEMKKQKEEMKKQKEEEIKKQKEEMKKQKEEEIKKEKQKQEEFLKKQKEEFLKKQKEIQKRRNEIQKKQAEIAIIIYTYDRYRLLVRLLDSIQRVMPKNKRVKVYIFDDASPRRQIYRKIDYSYEICYYRFQRNHGRFRWYHEISYIFRFLRNKPHHYYFFLNDDLEFISDGIEKAIRIYEGIKDQDKVAVNILNVRGPKCKWVKNKPHNYNTHLWRVYWTDTTFLCQYNFLEQFNFQITRESFFNVVKTQVYGSGVGEYISVILRKKRKNLYLVKHSILKHLGNHDSKMNHKERKKHPLIARL